ncbi:MAG: sulfur carrier protein ThiS [bacterium]
MHKIKIYINGEEKEINEKSTVQDVLNHIDIKSPMVVVEKNQEIIHQYDSCYLEEEDKLEIVSFFGGG